jgi:nicotinamidase-related amidase
MLRPDWDPATSAVIICDMWDAHHCVSAAQRVAEMAPRVNSVVTALRERGALIVHAPSDCVGFYSDTSARWHAIQAPHTTAPHSIDWNDWDDDERTTLPVTLTDPGSCSCDSAEPCCGAEHSYPWTRQTPLIDISSDDAVSDDGQEVFNLLQHRLIDDVVLVGVHTNVCILGRPFGIRQLVYLGKRPMLCRDLTDSFHRDVRGHFWGTEQVVAHIERRWCPTVTSNELVGGVPFRFRHRDVRSGIAFQPNDGP